ncbi:hypothetical protein FMUND_7409 [Fusarium mundagurra]|uniref:Uncharacterized protein n=1 Tax=Fusarium mundagurra TaxID=1567541 RepID=A0A8H6DGW7_9HYPO|nr:hypothetical protein FMUND_7409 [Fusarium mundagurra]
MSDQTNTTESSRPRTGLIASSLPALPDGYVSRLYPSDNHAINGPWTDQQIPLHQRFIEALGGIKWFLIDRWRIGYGESYEAMSRQHRSQRPFTICVSVRPGSTTVEQGQAAVLRCKQVLDEFGFTDVEVRIGASEGWGNLSEN